MTKSTMTDTKAESNRPPREPQQDPLAADYIRNAQEIRINTDLVIIQRLKNLYPGKHVTIVPSPATCDIVGFGKSGEAIVTPDPNSNGTAEGPLEWHQYVAPPSRLDGSFGNISTKTLFGKYLVSWKGLEYIVFVIEGRDGANSTFPVTNQYIIGNSPKEVSPLVLAAGLFTSQLHEEIWVYDQGYWQKDAALWRSIEKAEWKNVILDQKMKKSLIDDISRFYDNRSTYQRLGVPWKRGVIFHGPPGNGKTISIKATMHMLYKRKDEVPTLYVKTLANFRGPEAALNDIFSKARALAPCYLVFEDLDSLVTDSVRSFFLNQVDGIAANDGILMVGSTNHLERLDPGISKRPSRFDRKYLFPNPDLEQRIQYAEFWRHKVLQNQELEDSASLEAPGGDMDIEFPSELCPAFAKITESFSFAYMQEAFLASLLELVVGSDDDSASEEDKPDDEDELDKYPLWVALKKQVKILREQIGKGDDAKRSSVLPPTKPMMIGHAMATPRYSMAATRVNPSN
ncbi:ATPase [Microthyrium microscopicum]|uniref:ATPase n=1 Tax=Microthyrium microscopicum TaxID=703497 RepID=A0A6A6UP14_9PEZI|nr:ATPase [Microthyrium microscopicum]